MTTRAECDTYYRALGLPGFSTEYPAALVLALAKDAPESLALQIRRCLALADSEDWREYFDLSEYATEPEAVRAIVCPAREQRALFLLHPSGNEQRSLALHVIQPGGYCDHKYTDLRYACTPLSMVSISRPLERAITTDVSNLPPETVNAILAASGGVVLHPTDLDAEPAGFYDVLASPPFQLPRMINCMLKWVVWNDTQKIP